MYRRLAILTVIIVAALAALSLLGHHAVTKWAQGLEGIRQGEFAEVAEQIRGDVKRKFDEFVEAEEQRSYTDYLPYYVPENVVTAQQELPVLQSPLSNQYSNGFAYGYFQVEPDGRIVTPYAQDDQPDTNEMTGESVQEFARIGLNVRNNLLPSVTTPSGTLSLPEAATPNEARAKQQQATAVDIANQAPEFANSSKNANNFSIDTLQNQRASQVLTQRRQIVESNTDGQRSLAQTDPSVPRTRQDTQMAARAQNGAAQLRDLTDTVQIRIEPFVSKVVPAESGQPSLFGGQVFLLRHVQIEDRHLLQGFQLDENHFVAEVEESASRLMRDGMEYELPQVQPLQTAQQAAYTAILNFAFGDLVLNLHETDPAWISKRMAGLQRVYVGIIALVAVAVALALGSLWQNVHAQAQLAQKKDDFISAVSHELRTPLTSIRMYSEMLEKGWVKSADKLGEYYRSMRAESERLSRLVENVLDFSRMQKGRKKYAFQLGDINACVADVVAMMRPYAEQHGFAIEADLAAPSEIPFDKDAVTQIVVNLLDNAVKYAAAADDRVIRLRTRRQGQYTMIEVEDHGPGIPHRQRKKVFEQFYRYGAEPSPNRSQTTGTGLGLALVKRFAEAHNGFVEIGSAQPSGVTFRVGLGLPC